MSSKRNQVRTAMRAMLVVLLGTMLIVPSASASGGAVIDDCNDGGGITGKYSQSEYKSALELLSGDGDEYSDCRDQIKEAQQSAARAGSGSGAAGAKSSTQAPPSATGTTGGGTGSSAVTPTALGKALKEKGLDPSAAATTPGEAPTGVDVDGKEVDLSAGQIPSIATALSLPLPLAASAIVVLLSVALPVVRYLVGRFGGPPTTGTGTTP